MKLLIDPLSRSTTTTDFSVDPSGLTSTKPETLGGKPIVVMIWPSSIVNGSRLAFNSKRSAASVSAEIRARSPGETCFSIGSPVVSLAGVFRVLSSHAICNPRAPC